MSFDTKSDFQIDITPLTWLKPFSNNSIKHILKMAIFYHVIALLFMFFLMSIFFIYDPSLETPFYSPTTFVDYITEGPVEESIFFALPYFLSGNQYVMLGTGILWTLLHLGGFDEVGNFSIDWLTWENFVFIIPTFFFSYRTWLSGKGWIAIILHSAWNVGMFGLDCILGFGDCTLYDNSFDGIIDTWMLILGSGMLLGITYWAYVKRKKQDSQKSEILELKSRLKELESRTLDNFLDEQKRCTNCNRILSEYDKKDQCQSCENQHENQHNNHTS